MSIAEAPRLERPNRQAGSVDHVLFISFEHHMLAENLNHLLWFRHWQASALSQVAQRGHINQLHRIDNEQFQLAHQPQLVPALRDIIVTAAQWGHVHFVVLPVPYAASLLTVFDAFMQEFNEITLSLPNVLWLNDAERLDGARLAHSLGSNALIADYTTVSKVGRVARRAARAALRLIHQLKPSFVPEHVDLYDPSSQQP
ncbi:hypothetical protein AAVH_26289, partial [Aphelenchoides avenae]